MLRLKVVLEDEGWVLVDKPARFHTHPPESKDLRILPRWNAQGIIEKQLGMKVFPAHRLDRATSGLLLYSKDRALNEKLQRQFAERSVKKTYFAMVRGKMRAEQIIEEPLKTESGELREARTVVTPCFSFNLPLPHPRDPASESRAFTFVKAEPLTGRFHQIRRHLAGIGHPILLDTRHGDKKLNRAFAELTGCDTLLLRCMGLGFRCPRTGKQVDAWARWGKDWHRLFGHAGACPLTTSPSRAQPSPS